MLYPMKNIKIFAFLAVFLLSAAVSTAWAWKGSGTSDAPYQITSAADLTQLAIDVNGGKSYSNMYFKQTADITLSGEWTPIGTQSNPFKGHYDGGGFAIRGLRVTGNYKHAGLFGYISSERYNGSQIFIELKNINIVDCVIDVGTVDGSAAGGIAGETGGPVRMTGNRVRGSITAYGNTGGLIGIIRSNATVSNNFVDVTVSGTGNQYNQYFHPEVCLMVSVSGGSSGGSGNYYHDNGGNVSVSLNTNITATPVYSVTTSVAGLTMSDANVTLDGVKYYETGKTVTFGFSGSGSVEYFVNRVRIKGNSVIVRQNLDVQIGVSYIDENGKPQILELGKYTVLTSLTDVSNLSGGWYVVLGEVKYTSQVTFNGDAHLILADGAEMTIETEDNGIFATGNLTIYGQSGQGGILNATAKGTSYGIFGYYGVTIIGGTVTATGIYGDNGVTIIGGTVEATGSSYGIYGSNGVTINGGSVTASGSYRGIYSNGDITLGWTNSTDFIYASSYSPGVNEKHVSIAEGKSFKDEYGKVYRGTLTKGQVSYLEGQKLEPFEGVSVSFVDNFSGASDVFAEIAVDGEGHVSAPSKHPFRMGYTFAGWFTTADGGTEFDFSAAITGNTTAYAKWSVPYIDKNGKTQIRKPGEYTVLTEKTIVSNLGGGWYVVQGEVKYKSQVKFSGDAYLILADGATMEIETGGNGIYATGNLTIYGQSKQSEQSGTLTATGGDVGIYNDFGDITIIGGTVTATGDFVGIRSRGNITLGWTNSTDFIKANSYYCGKGSVSIAEGKSLKDENGYVYSGTLNAGQLASLKGQKIEPFEGVSVSFVDNFGETPIVIAKSAVDGEDHVAALAKHPIHRGYTFAGWFTASEGDTEFNFSTKVLDNTTAYAKWKENTPVEYIDEDGNKQVLKPDEYTMLTNDMYVDDLPGGWYVVQGDVKYTRTVSFSGNAHLILADGAKMEIVTEGRDEHGINANGNLTIYGQNGQSGILNATAKGLIGSGIYGDKGVTINGGSVTASGTNGSGIFGYNGVTINGGSVTASGTNGDGIYGDKGVTINGGSVTASGTNGDGIYGDKGVTISGGMVTATGGKDGIYSREGNITLSWTNSTDFIYASSYHSDNGSVKIAEGKSFKDDKGKAYRGTLTGEQLSAIKSKKLEPCYAVTFDAQNGDEPIMLLTTFDENGVAHVAKPADPIRSGFTFEGWFTATDGNTEFDFSAAITGNTTAYAKWSVPYIDENGTPKSVTDFIVLTEDNKPNENGVINLPGGWYVVQGKVKYTNQVKFEDDAHLILADGATMEIETEGESEYGIYASNNLTIYGQSKQSEQSGILNATAKGTKGTGIYSGNGKITIIGGSVTATGSDSYGIYGYKGVTISGGTVKASGNSSGINTAGHITLGWTNSTDFIKVSSIYLGADSCTVSIAKGKSFVDENGNEYRDTLTDENLESIKNKTLTPLMPFPDNIVIANISDTTYTGDSIRPEPAVTIGENDTLELGKDYTLAYKDNLNASNTAKVIVKGAGKYYGEVQKSFTIDKAPLKITALNDTIVYGDEPGNQGVAYDGFVGNETSEVLKGELALEIGYKRYDDAGKYAITPSGLNADNYKIEFVAGTLTVEPKVISIVWGERTKFGYDGKAHAPTVTAKDFVEGHDVSLVVTGAAVEVGNYIAKVALDENDANSKNYKLRASELEKKFKIVMPVAYIDENGVEQTVTDYTVLTSDVTDYIENGVINLPGGWYVVQGKVKYTNQVKFEDDAHLILADGAKLEIETNGESEHGIYASNNLTIYGQSMQSDQSGTLKVKTTGDNSLCIYSYSGDITISGGTVTATGIFGIYGFKGVTIKGGTVEATGTGLQGSGIFGNGTVTISGGKVTATGNDGIRSYNGNITLGWTNDTDHITASSYYSVNGSVSIAKDKYFKDEKGKEYSGTIDDVSDIAGKTLVPSFNGKFLSDVNIAVADIPVQKYADGEPICPSVLVTDGKDTLNAGTDYMVTCFNNTTVSSARLDKAAIAQITGKGNYAGVIQKRFFIWNNIRDYAAVQVFQDAVGKTHAEIDGAYDGADAVAIDEDVAVDTVVFSREFTVNLENGGFSTIMLPFDIKAENLTGVKSIFEFNGVDNNAVGVKYVWCNATIGRQEFEKGNPDCNTLSGELNAYTPYMVEMDTPTLGINGKVKLKSRNNATNSVVSKNNWVFRGALKKKEWSKEDDDIKNGQIWAFAGSARNGASIGKFVQFGGNNWVNPFRAYLVDCTTYPDASECKDETQPKPSLVSRYRFADALAPATSAENSLSAKTPTASVTASLDGMEVVIVYGDKDSVGEHTTVIGRMNPATGEIRMLPRTTQTYDLKGRRVNEGRKAKGAYYRK